MAEPAAPQPALAELMARKPPVRRQHFVPRFYLDYFGNSDRKLHVLHTRDRRIGKPRSSRAVAYAEYFYAVRTGVPDRASHALEIAFEDVENQFSKILPPIIELIRFNDALIWDDKQNLSIFMSHLWLRSPEVRRVTNDLEVHVARMTAKMAACREESFDEYDKRHGIVTPPEKRERIKREIFEDKFEVTPTNAQHLLMQKDMETYARLFYSTRWRVYVNKTTEPFITSDNPLTVVPDPMDGPYGPTFLQRTHYLALTPQICIRAYGSCDMLGKPMVRKTLFPGDELQVLDINATLASYATRYALAGDRSTLQHLLDGGLKP